MLRATTTAIVMNSRNRLSVRAYRRQHRTYSAYALTITYIFFIVDGVLLNILHGLVYFSFDLKICLVVQIIVAIPRANRPEDGNDERCEHHEGQEDNSAGKEFSGDGIFVEPGDIIGDEFSEIHGKQRKNY